MAKTRKCMVIVHKEQEDIGKQCTRVPKYKQKVKDDDGTSTIDLCLKHYDKFQEGRSMVVKYRGSFFIIGR